MPDPSLVLETPFGTPVRWADVALVTDVGDSHELNDDRCLVLTSKDLSDRATGPLRDFMLCLLADGATGSTFNLRAAGTYGGDSPKQAGWRASQLAQAAFVERFLSSAEVDILDRLKDALRAADRALNDSGEGTLSTTLVALFISADGTSYATSIGDSTMLVLPPRGRRKTPGARRLKKLGYEESTSVGSGDTTLQSIDENLLIEQWWPNKEAGAANTRLEPGTFLVLLSDGISDNLPAETIDRLLQRHKLHQATVALPLQTRERRLEAQKRTGASTQQLGLDNMSAVVVRYAGTRARNRPPSRRLDDSRLLSVQGTHGGPMPTSGGHFGIICVAGEKDDLSPVPSFLRLYLESEHLGTTPQRLAEAVRRATVSSGQPRLAALAVDEQGRSHAFASGGASVEPAD